MSRKKTNKSHYFLFANNISKIATDNGGKYALAASLGVVYDSVRRWCNGDNLPDGHQLLAIRDKFNVSIDWLLSGTEPLPVAANKISDEVSAYGPCKDSLDKWPDEIKDACRQVKKILLSDHPVIKPALISNLAAFQYSVDKEESQDVEIRKLNQRLKLLEEFHEAKQCTGTDGTASSSIGNEKT